MYATNERAGKDYQLLFADEDEALADFLARLRAMNRIIARHRAAAQARAHGTTATPPES